MKLYVDKGPNAGKGTGQGFEREECSKFSRFNLKRKLLTYMFKKLSESHTQDTEKCRQLNKISLLKSSNEDKSSEQPQEEKKTYSVQRNKDVRLSAEMMR